MERNKNAFVIRYMKKIITVLFLLGIISHLFSFSVEARDVSPVAQIPLKLESGYLVLTLPVESSGSLSFVFDTGCQTTAIGQDVFKKVNRDQTITLLLGTQKLKIDNYRINDFTALSKKLGQKIDGIIGNDILHRYTVNVNFNNNVLTLFNSREFITNPDGEDIRIGVNSLVSSLPLRITFPGGQQIEGEFVIDTGAPVTVIINSPLAEESGLYANLDKSKELKFKLKADVQTAVDVLAESVRIGKFECVAMHIFISTSNRGLFAVSKYAGIVGNGFLRNFNVIFDYRRKRLNIEKY
jgi:predicted aspartyl protease